MCNHGDESFVEFQLSLFDEFQSICSQNKLEGEHRDSFVPIHECVSPRDPNANLGCNVHWLPILGEIDLEQCGTERGIQLLLAAGDDPWFPSESIERLLVHRTEVPDTQAYNHSASFRWSGSYFVSRRLDCSRT